MFSPNDFNLHQRRWLELLKYYDINVLYQPSKAIMVANSLTRLLMGCVAYLEDVKKELVHDIHRFSRIGIELVDSIKDCFMVHNGSKSSFLKDMTSKKVLHPILVQLEESILTKSIESFSQGGDCVLDYQG